MGGIVIAILLSFILFPIVVVIVMLFSRIWYRKVKDLGPPPTRHGSQRFVSAKTDSIYPNSSRSLKLILTVLSIMKLLVSSFLGSAEGEQVSCEC